MTAQTCPNCNGSGKGFDAHHVTAPPICLSCGGTGVVWPPPVFKYEDGRITQVSLVDERIISEEEARQFVEDNKLQGYVETSALTGQNVEEAFRMLAKETLS